MGGIGECGICNDIAFLFFPIFNSFDIFISV